MFLGAVLLISLVLWFFRVLIVIVKIGVGGLLGHFLPRGSSGVFMLILPVLELFS